MRKLWQNHKKKKNREIQIIFPRGNSKKHIHAIAHPDKTVWKWILFWKYGSPQMNYLYFHNKLRFKVEPFLKYLTMNHSGSWDIAIFVMTILLILQFLTIFTSIELQTFVRKDTPIPKSQTMLLRFLQLLEVNTIGKLLVAISHWKRLICKNGNSKSNFFQNQTFE